MWTRRIKDRAAASSRTIDPAPTVRGAVDLLITAAQTQLLAQTLDSDNVDGRSMGVLGLNGALVAGDLATKAVFGVAWWIPLPGLAISALILLGVRRGIQLELGPSPRDFHDTYGSLPGDRAKLQLIADFDDALRRNAGMLVRKERRLGIAVVVLLLTLVYSTAVLA